MAKEVLSAVEDAADGGYIAHALGYSIFTEADSWEELKRTVQDAARCRFDEGELPDLIRVHAAREKAYPREAAAGSCRRGVGCPAPTLWL